MTSVDRLGVCITTSLSRQSQVPSRVLWQLFNLNPVSLLCYMWLTLYHMQRAQGPAYNTCFSAQMTVGMSDIPDCHVQVPGSRGLGALPGWPILAPRLAVAFQILHVA